MTESLAFHLFCVGLSLLRRNAFSNCHEVLNQCTWYKGEATYNIRVYVRFLFLPRFKIIAVLSVFLQLQSNALTEYYEIIWTS